ncbi:hypothetical protein B0O80DRAFT_130960 [Mortierella sp. GBAus27b]|nr:hypothetical protein BGX31_009969 [Mortierella sp. GBA43]KAI8350528.1 hypothetical protein B0O80DRAFT_130960 [Mortierella sp. GBAus27b]
MATETVIYVSLALVLLTRIYVFINPPEFLEEHKDRRMYHEYHLYRQYHLHKQYDKNEDVQREDDDRASLPSTTRYRSTLTSEEKGEHLDMSSLEGLHHPSEELVLLGRDLGTHSLSLQDLSTHDMSKLGSIASPPLSPLSPSTPLSPQQESEREVWDRILGAPVAEPTANYISLHISEIHYNGSLEKFDQDLEVLKSIRELKAGQRNVTEECPIMTIIWESGRWCCLEGRTLYILRALEWKGQVRVRVLVDKDPMLLAVTEDYWKASGMAMTLGEDMAATSPSTVESRSVDSRIESSAASTLESATSTPMTIATAETSTATVGLSLSDDGLSRLSSPATKTTMLPLMPGSPHGHEADDELDQEQEVESDGYLEDDEGDEDDLVGIQQRMGSLDLWKQRRHSKAGLSLKYPRYLRKRSEDHGVTPALPPSPLLLPNTGREMNAGLDRKAPFGSMGDDSLRGSRTFQQGRLPHQPLRTKLQHQLNMRDRRDLHHERKISIPEFMLPPPLHDERTYVIIDPNAATAHERMPPRRDSGHGNSA